MLIASSSFAQFATIPLNQTERAWYENDLLREANQVHTAIYPLRKAEVTAFDRRQGITRRQYYQRKRLKQLPPTENTIRTLPRV